MKHVIIDRKTSKRLKEIDPIKGNPLKEVVDESSPMSPPDAYAEPTVKQIPYDDMAEILKRLITEHNISKEQIMTFEKALVRFRELDWKLENETNVVFKEFFFFFDNKILTHNYREEKVLFPLLNQRLIETGEHGGGQRPQTAVDIMEDDHIKFIQLGVLTFNLIGLGSRLPDPESRKLTFEIAYDNGMELIEMLRLHIFREDHTLFPLAQKLIKKKEFREMKEKMDLLI